MATITLTQLKVDGVALPERPTGFVVDGIKHRQASIDPDNAEGTRIHYVQENKLGERVFEVTESMNDITLLINTSQGSAALEVQVFEFDGDDTWEIPHGLGRPIFFTIKDADNNDITGSVAVVDDGTSAVFTASEPISGTVTYH